MFLRLTFLIAAWLIALHVYVPAHAQSPNIFLLKTYDDSRDVIGWVMSEKLDGVRGIWDGEKLTTRGGAKVHAPAWFVRDFPPFALDGELWTKRGDFENIVSIVRRQAPDARWRQVQYHVFEAPHQKGGLRERLAVLAAYIHEHAINDHAINNAGHDLGARIKIIPQIDITERAQLNAFLDDIVAGGGEGVVVRDPTTPYQTGRLSSALKVKKYTDADCVVEKILPGKGKYRGQMGAVECRMANGRAIKIGSGFSDKNRANPPAVGAVITFKYYGLSRKGVPRFAVFLRIRKP